MIATMVDHVLGEGDALLGIEDAGHRDQRLDQLSGEGVGQGKLLIAQVFQGFPTDFGLGELGDEGLAVLAMLLPQGPSLGHEGVEHLVDLLALRVGGVYLVEYPPGEALSALAHIGLGRRVAVVTPLLPGMSAQVPGAFSRYHADRGPESEQRHCRDCETHLSRSAPGRRAPFVRLCFVHLEHHSFRYCHRVHRELRVPAASTSHILAVPGFLVLSLM